MSSAVRWSRVDYVADTFRRAVRRVEICCSVPKVLQGLLHRLEFADSAVDVHDACVEQVDRSAAWCPTVIADHEQVSDLGEGEPDGLAGFDELHLVNDVVIVCSVAVGAPTRCGELACFFVETQGLGSGAGLSGEFARSVRRSGGTRNSRGEPA